jgi:hypothetical protein
MRMQHKGQNTRQGKIGNISRLKHCLKNFSKHGQNFAQRLSKSYFLRNCAEQCALIPPTSQNARSLDGLGSRSVQPDNFDIAMRAA